MRIYHDWEFLENGETIRPIALAMCTDDGRELYRVFDDVGFDPLYTDICRNSWLMENVVKHLPRRSLTSQQFAESVRGAGAFALDFASPLVTSREQIREDVKEFLGGYPDGIELWGWYSSYDHVCLAQLFGKMIDLPDGVPMWTNDLRQRLADFRLSEDHLPGMNDKNHDPLAEVRLMRGWAFYMDGLERDGNRYGLL